METLHLVGAGTEDSGRDSEEPGAIADRRERAGIAITRGTTHAASEACSGRGFGELSHQLSIFG